MSAQSISQVGQAALPTLNLWEAALQDLKPEERDIINNHTQDARPAEVLHIVEDKRREVWKNRVSFKRSTGEVVFLHDILAKVTRWVKKFVEVGDAAVQYDPAHAALPWAAVRFILQASINDIQLQATVLESVEDVARAIPLGAIIECLYLAYPSTAAGSLRMHLKSLYALCWYSLAKAIRYHDQGKMKRVLKSVLDVDSEMSSLSKSIENQWILVERSATLARDDSLFSHMSKSQSYSEQLLRMVDEIRTPISRIETYVEGTHQTLANLERDKILDSISTIPYRRYQTKVNRNVLPGTGEWLLDQKVVRNWFSSSASEILWLHGIPGSGKSSLVSVVVARLIAESTQNPSSHPVYFYCTRNPAEKERADPTHILRSLLRQLVMPRSTDALPTCVVEQFENERSFESLDLDATLDLIKAIIETRTITYIVLDALDECDAALRDELSIALETILQESQSLVKIFVSSRNDADLVCWLSNYPNKEILSSDNRLDLVAFIDDEVDKRVDGRPRRLLRARKISDDLRDEIKWTLKAQAQGMFLWAELQLQYLCKLVTENDIRQRLGALPKSLAEIYHDIYERNMSELRDDNPQYEIDAKKVFHLMLSSDEPWNPIDMANMLEPAENEMDRGPEKVFRVTFHLVTHDYELDVLRFAHLSVREYFETMSSEFTPPRSTEANVEACFDYLEKTREFGSRPLSYPSRWWCHNVMKLQTDGFSSQFTDRLVQFFIRDDRTFQGWLKEINDESRMIDLPSVQGPIDYLVSKDGTPVFAVCFLGLEDILSLLIKEKPGSLHARNLRQHSPLTFTCSWTRNVNVVSVLLENGAAFSDRRQDSRVFTAIGAAVFFEQPSIEIIKKLLDGGADPNGFYGMDIRSALTIATSKGLTEAVELLLEYGADPNLPSGYSSRRPLFAALREREGPCKIVRKLLEAGARLKNVDFKYKDALQLAVEAGREDFVTTLLSFGADVNALDSKRAADANCKSPLFLAIESGAEQTAWHLLSHGADPVARNRTEQIILETLLLTGDAELAKTFLSVPSQKVPGIVMLQASQLLGEDELITRLEILSDLDPGREELEKLIDLASQRDLLKVFKHLVEHACNCSLLYHSGSGILAETARRGQLDMFKTLWTCLLRGRSKSSIGDDLASADPSDSDAFIASLHIALSGDGSRTRFSSLLHAAAVGGVTGILRFLLAEGADTTTARLEGSDESQEAAVYPIATSTTSNDRHASATNEVRNHGAWYLHAAVEADHADMVELLLRLGADANAIASGCDEQNALCTALLKKEKHLGIIELLLRAGADVNARMFYEVTSDGSRERHYGTALAIALLGDKMAECTFVAVIELLLEHGADVNATSDQYGSVLQLAVSQRHVHATKLLLERGAAVDIGGGVHGSPLIAAVVLSDEDETGTNLIEILLESGADVNAEHLGRWKTALEASLRSGGSFAKQIFHLLVANGADLLKTGHDGAQMLQIACSTTWDDDDTLVEYLLSRGVDVNASGGEYGNALQAACACFARPNLVELLINKGADVNARGGIFGNALQAASSNGSIRNAEILLANGADVQATGGHYGSALQAAASSNSPVQMTKLLLSYGADINTSGGIYGTALQAAVSSVSPILMTELLLSHGANINTSGGIYGTALQAACTTRLPLGPEPIISFLLSKGADVNFRGGKYGYALICAVAEGESPTDVLESVSTLLDGGADINCSHESHGNALYAACRRSSISMMRMLIERGISLTQLAGEHEHALFVACQLNEGDSGNNDSEDDDNENEDSADDDSGDDERVRVLLDNGVDVNIRGNRYSCALEVAIRAENLTAAKSLIERGADIHVETTSDGTLLDLAVRLSFSKMVDLLRANGA